MNSLLKWFRSFFKSTPRELVYVPYSEGDKLIRENKGWRIAPEEDRNRNIGWVYLERDVVQP